MAAYLYLLHQDNLALAWEYLRRHPDYRRDWQQDRRCVDTARRWGLRVLEDPALDSRAATPAWLCESDAVLHLHLDADPPQNARAFEFWNLPGSKHLLHDGKRLLLLLRESGRCTRLVLAPEVEEGKAYFYGVRACGQPGLRARTMAAELDKLAEDTASHGWATTRSRPTAAELLELHTLQALDGVLAGASLRNVAEGVFGADAVEQGWYADSGLRSRVRRLVRRGQAFMRGGYRRLAQIE